MKLALGTAQFGLPYGVTNARGQVSGDEVRAILRLASSNGISVLDTAAAYGNAERILGEIVGGDGGFQVITKLPPLKSHDGSGVRYSLDRFSQSLSNLKVRQVHGLLVHRYEDLAGAAGHELFDALDQRRVEGETKFVGVSVYSPEQAVELAERFPLDIVQLPLNILDQRAVSDGLFDRLAASGVSVYVRSIFLQGVLVADPVSLPSSLPKPLLSAARRVDDFAVGHAMTRLETSLGYMKVQPVDAAIVGVTAVSELNEILSAWHNLPSRDALSRLPWSTLAISDHALVDPRLWPA